MAADGSGAQRILVKVDVEAARDGEQPPEFVVSGLIHQSADGCVEGGVTSMLPTAPFGDRFDRMSSGAPATPLSTPMACRRFMRYRFRRFDAVLLEG